MHDTESIMNTQYNVTHDVFLRQQQAHTPKKKKKNYDITLASIIVNENIAQV